MTAATVDLHAHTTASDGTFTPTELVQAAQSAGLSVLAVTDHDTTAGVAEAQAAAHRLGIRLVPGVELSVEGSAAQGGKCHLLGLGIDPADRFLNETLATLSAARKERNEKIIARLNALGIPVTMEQVIALAPRGANLGRPHLAAALVAVGAVPDLPTAFRKYLGDSATAFVEKESLSAREAITLVQAAGGLCFLAHPTLVKLNAHETIGGRVASLAALGIDGIEAYYSQHSPADEAKMLRLAERHRLLVSGGSDFHGANKPDVPLGKVRDGLPLTEDALPATVRDLWSGTRRATVAR